MNYYSMILLGWLNFYLEMLIPVLLLMRRQERRSLFFLRLLPLAAIGAGLVFLPTIAIGPFGMSYLIVMVIVFFAAWFLFKVSPLDALFYTVAAFAVQHAMWDILFMIYEGIGEMTQATALIIYFSLYLAAYVLFYFFFPVSDVHKGGMKGRVLQFVVSFFIIAFVYVIASLVPWYDEWNILYRLYALVCCIFAIGLQCGLFEHSKLKERNRQLEQDKAILQELLIREQKHYNITKDTIDLVNLKCHDLKHQIAVLRNMSEEEREKSLGEFEKAVMRVRNYGIGIANDDLKLVFDRFYKVDKSRSLNTKSVGLGLYICKNIIELHNGRIYATSEDGKYTEFTIELPLRQD